MELFVIKDHQGNYVTLRGSRCVRFSGVCTGFSWYSDKVTAEEELGVLGDGFYIESFNGIRDIPEGELLI